MSEANYAAPLIEMIGGKEVSFPHLKMREYSEIEERVRGFNRERVRKIAEEAKLSGKDKFNELMNSDSMDVSPAMVDYYLQSHAGASWAIKKSLSKAGKSEAEIAELIDNLEVLDAVNIARSLVGFARRVHLEEVVKPPLPESGQ